MSAKKSKTKTKKNTQKNLRDFLRTESGNAEMFAAVWGKDVRYDNKRQRWLVWNGQRWIGDADRTVRRYMRSATRRCLQEALRLAPEDDNRQNEVRWWLQSESRSRIDAALELAKGEPPVFDSGEAWDADPWLLGVANGILDLRTGKLRKATQYDRITKFSPVAFDPDAKCPRWLQFLDEVFGQDASLIRFVQKAVGYSLTGNVEEHCLFACWGTGRNGKSTLLEVIYYILGKYATTISFSALESKHPEIGEGERLPGARFAKSVETAEGRALDEARIKSWTGGDTMTVRLMRRNRFEFPPTFKLWLAFNHKPIIRDNSPAMWARMKLIPFTRRFEGRQRDKGLLRKLKDEAPGILNWAVTGCLAWQAEGLNAPQAVEAATRKYEQESDTLSAFISECCETGEGFEVGRAEVYVAYCEWCREDGQQPLAQRDFKSRMAQKFTPGRSGHGGKKVWKRLRLQPVAGNGGGCPMVSEISGNSPIETSTRKDTEKPDTIRHPDTTNFGTAPVGRPSLIDFAEDE